MSNIVLVSNMRISKTYTLPVPDFKSKLLLWANRFNRVCFLDSNGYANSGFDCLVAVDSADEITADENIFSSLKDFYTKKKDWLFGFISYDAKNETEKLYSANPDFVKFPVLHFFQPKYLFELKNNSITLSCLSSFPVEYAHDAIMEQIAVQKTEITSFVHSCPVLKQRVSRKEYIERIQKIKEHIYRGDCYELNYCQEFYSENTAIHPVSVYQKLMMLSPAPFSCYYRIDDKYLLCASPERFLKKTSRHLLSQPIKGTARRGKTKEDDELLKKQLFHDAKERAENVMVVDLVRNDLSRIAETGSVKVDELYGIYSFPQVHQMISSISAEVRYGIDCPDIIKNTFPMGSMTGAPKVKVMQLIEKYEKTRRGLYSGTTGYITPNADFDFNVVIRSMLYNGTDKYLSFITGGGITCNSVPEKEYEECLLKAHAMIKALEM